jgi:hypothetical protein
MRITMSCVPFTLPDAATWSTKSTIYKARTEQRGLTPLIDSFD